MNAAEFFKIPALQLPLCRKEEDSDFGAYLRGIFQKYLAEFDNLTSSEPLPQRIKKHKSEAADLCEGVMNAIGEYMRGFPHGALEELSKAIKPIRPHVDRLRAQENDRFLEELYRVRAERPNEQPGGMWFRREDLFHIPFEKRHCVTR